MIQYDPSEVYNILLSLLHQGVFPYLDHIMNINQFINMNNLKPGYIVNYTDDSNIEENEKLYYISKMEESKCKINFLQFEYVYIINYINNILIANNIYINDEIPHKYEALIDWFSISSFFKIGNRTIFEINDIKIDISKTIYLTNLHLFKKYSIKPTNKKAKSIGEIFNEYMEKNNKYNYLIQYNDKIRKTYDIIENFKKYYEIIDENCTGKDYDYVILDHYLNIEKISLIEGDINERKKITFSRNKILFGEQTNNNESSDSECSDSFFDAVDSLGMSKKKKNVVLSYNKNDISKFFTNDIEKQQLFEYVIDIYNSLNSIDMKLVGNIVFYKKYFNDKYNTIIESENHNIILGKYKNPN
jgi:hypothetical protein